MKLYAALAFSLCFYGSTIHQMTIIPGQAYKITENKITKSVTEYIDSLFTALQRYYSGTILYSRDKSSFQVLN